MPRSAFGALLVMLMACGRDAETPRTAEPGPVLRSVSEVPAHVGEIVTLEGTVTETKLPTLVGVDVNEVDADGHDVRGKRCHAVGRLEKKVVTQAELDREPIHANRGAGTFYSLVASDGHGLAKPVPLAP